MKTRKQLRDSLRNLYEIIDNYENDFRPDFLQGEYSHWIADYDDPKSMDYWKKDGEFCVVGWLAVNKEIELPHYIHDLKKTGYVFKGKVMQNKYEYRDEGNVKVG